MVQQKSFAEFAFDAPRKVTKRERFLTEMERVMPWSELLALIEPHYPRPKAHGGRPALALRDQTAYLLPATVLQPVRSGR